LQNFSKIEYNLIHNIKLNEMLNNFVVKESTDKNGKFYFEKYWQKEPEVVFWDFYCSFAS